MVPAAASHFSKAGTAAKLLILSFLTAALSFPCPVSVRPTPRPKQSGARVSANHLHALGLALLEYVSDNDSKLPPMQTIGSLEAALLPYFKGEADAKNLFVQPGSGGRGYVTNKLLSGKEMESGAPWVFLLYEPVPATDGSREVCYGGMVRPNAQEANPPAMLIFKVERISRVECRSLLAAKIQTVPN